MRMTAFRIENYRSVLDSGWIEVHDISVITGKNESGKTSLLKALWKFNPFSDEPYDLDREWPRGHRRERSEEKPVATVRFEFTPEERLQLIDIDSAADSLTGVEVQRNYRGDYTYNLLPETPDIQPHNLKWAFNVLKERFSRTPYRSYNSMKDGAQDVLETFRRQPGNGNGNGHAADTAPSSSSPLQVLSPQARTATALLEQKVHELSPKPVIRQIVETVHGWLPTFVFMDDYKVFKGATQLDQLLQRKLTNKLAEEDRTVIKIMEMAGLDLENEVAKGRQIDREQRILDLNDASQTLTEEIAHRWSQKKYEVMFQADGQHFITFVKDVGTSVLIPLEERSKGFQWFFSFDMTFMYETSGMFQNAIILLDEPGLHLHAAAQRDLLARMRSFARHSQLIYTTHLPFMIDFANLDHTFIAEERPQEGTKVHRDWGLAGRDARYTLQAACTLAWSQSLYSGRYNLVVDHLVDLWLLSTVSALLEETGRGGLDRDILITPAGGGREVAFIGSLLHGDHPQAIMLTSADPEEGSDSVRFARRWLTNGESLLVMKDVLSLPYPCTVEDLFPPEEYLAWVNATYRNKFAQQPLEFTDAGGQPVLQRVTQALAARGMRGFSRKRVARRMLTELAGKPAETLSPQTIERFAALFAAINKITQKWKQA
ncbi:MAG: AAA family ATPase [Armatimonadota bacterium]